MPETNYQYNGSEWTAITEPDTSEHEDPEAVEPSDNAGLSSEYTLDSEVEGSSGSDYITVTKYVCGGTVEVSPTQSTSIKAKTTVKLKGLGKFISGTYFVESVKHDFTKDGYTCSLEVTRNNMETLKG